MTPSKVLYSEIGNLKHDLKHNNLYLKNSIEIDSLYIYIYIEKS